MRHSERMDESVCNGDLRDSIKVDMWGGGTGTFRFCRMMDDLQRSRMPLRDGAMVEALEGRGFSSWQVNLQLTYSFRSHCGPGVDSASNRNEYQEYFLGEGGGKGGRCVGLTILLSSCADCIEIVGASASWNPQGLSRPVMGELLEGV